MNNVQKKMLLGILFSYLIVSEANGTCLRCTKIEEEREKEQANQQKKIEYYEDEIEFSQKKSTDKL